MNLSGFHLRILAAVLSGTLAALGFPGQGFPSLSAGFLLPFAYVPLFVAIDSLPKPYSGGRGAGRHERMNSPWKRFKSAFLLTWLAGMTTVALAFFWCTSPAILFGGIPPLVAYPAFGVYAILSGTFFPVIFMPFLLSAAHEARRQAKPLPLYAMALLTTALEIWTPRFFHWSLGSLMHSSLAVSQFASVLGFSGITLLIVLSNAYLARAIAERAIQPIRALSRIVAVAAMWAAVIFWGNWRLGRVEAELAAAAESTHIGLVQPNFTFDELSSNKTRSPMAQEQSLDHLLKISEEVMVQTQPKLDLLVWPESVAPGQFAMSAAQIERTKDLVQQTAVPILVQATEYDREEIKMHGMRQATFYSTSFLLRPDRSRSSSFKKWVPMPFGEFVPLEDIFPEFGEFLRDNIGNMSKVGRGKSYEALAYSARHFAAPLICFDAIDTDLPRLQVKYGQGNVLINQSNFVWMGNSNAGFQFKELVRFRAIENGRSAVLAANTGPSVIFNPVGRELTATTRLLEPSFLTAQVPIWRKQTVYNFCGDLPLQLGGAVGFLVLCVAMSNVNRRRQKNHMLH